MFHVLHEQIGDIIPIVIYPSVIFWEDTMPFLIVLAVAIRYCIHRMPILLNELLKISHCTHLLLVSLLYQIYTDNDRKL